jgi:hypothetical protein
VKAIVTRTFPAARVHVNGEYTFGDAPEAGEVDAIDAEHSRWMGGIAVDRTFPLRSFLVGAELVARAPLVDDGSIDWTTAAGLRYQLGPRTSLDAGVGAHLDGPARGWFVTAGAAFSLNLAWSARR